MRRFAPLLLLLVAAGASAEEPAGVTCGLYAVVDDDAGALAIYDGLRKGLELAQLPRVCREDRAATDAERQAFLIRTREAGQEPLFAIGDEAAAWLATARSPCVAVVQRYTAGGRPVTPLPAGRRLFVVHAAVALEQAARVLRALTGADPVRAAFAGAPGAAEPRLRAALGLADDDAGAAAPQVLLHLRPSTAAVQPALDEALARARKLGVPLVSDDRAHFGRGAVVVLVPRHDLVGRVAAEMGRLVRADPLEARAARAVPGFEVWVDLAAADAQGIAVPLPFLARADKIKRGRPRPAKAPR